MEILKKLGHWILFIIGSFIGIFLVLSITFYLPTIVYNWILNWNIILFMLVGGVFVIIYYWVARFLVNYLYIFTLMNYKPDYWVSSIFQLLCAIIFAFYYYITLDKYIDNPTALIESFKGIMFIIFISSFNLRILYWAITYPFKEEKDFYIPKTYFEW